MSFFAQNLRFLRQQRRLSEADLALSLDLWEDTIKRYEQGRAEPALDVLLNISDALAIPLDHLLRRDLMLQRQRMAQRDIRLLLLDVDGTLTDGRMYYGESGDLLKAFHVKDGMIIHRLITRKGMQVGFISSSSAKQLTERRAETLGVQLVQAGPRPKVEVAAEWCGQLGINFEQIAFVGDDLNDLPLLRKVGISACPSDAVAPVRNAVQIVLTRRGGEGCIRELIEDVLGIDVG